MVMVSCGRRWRWMLPEFASEALPQKTHLPYFVRVVVVRGCR